MNSNGNRPGEAAALRQRAEDKAAQSTQDREPLSPAATRLTLHELRVHQIELEMQNEELRRSHAELDAARARYFDLYDLAPIGYVTVSEQDQILEANLTAATLLGVARGTLVKQLASRFILEDDQDHYYRLRKQLFATGEPQAYELRMVKQDGAAFWAHLAAAAAQDAGGAAVCRIVLSDITERKQTEVCRDLSLKVLEILNRTDGLPESIRRVVGFVKGETGSDAVGLRLQEGEDFPYFAQEGFPAAFLLTENSLVARGPDGGVCRDKNGNVRLECTCGLVISGRTDPAHPLFTRGGSFWTNDSAPLLGLPPGQDPRQHPHNQCILQGYASMALIPVRDKERIVGLLHLNARRKGCFSLATVKILEDLASHIGEALTRKRAEEALRASQHLLEGIINAIPVSLFWKDTQLTYLGCNVNFARDAGFADPKDVIGKDDYQMGWRAQADLYRGDDRAVIESGCPKLLIEEPQTTPEGNTLTLLTSKLPLRNSQGEISGILGIYQDITAHRRHEAELQKLDKLQSVGMLAGGIAHDFNNVLLGIFGNISIAMEDLAKEHPSYAPLVEAEKAMTRSIRLTKQLLTFAKGGDPVKASVSLGAMVEEVVRFDLSGSNVSLVYHYDEALWPVDADRGQIQQVVSNLVINACQAMPKGGRLRVTLGNADLPDAAVPTLKQGRYVKVMVQDEGGGIEPQVIGHIFDPYFTTKQTGSGLGLATVWSIITKHGGHIGVVSELGKGTTFTFYLPASAAPLPAEAKPPAAEPPPPPRAAKILMMDDEKMITALATQMLTRCGYSVATASGGQEAVALYRQALEAGAPFDVVIMDLTIPGGPGGKDVVQDLLALDPDVRALVSSGYAADPVMAKPARYGFKGAVVKPYTARVLREAVARLLT